MPEVRQSVSKSQAKEDRMALLYTKNYHEIDPANAVSTIIDKNDPQRIQRALEVFEITGQPPINDFFKQNTCDPMPYQAIKLVMMPY